jgi:hypothetical protein
MPAIEAPPRGRMHRMKIDISQVPADHRLGTEEMDDGIWLIHSLAGDVEQRR